MLPMAVTCTNITAILHGRVGGPATAVVLANAILGLAGFGVALLIGHLAQFVKCQLCLQNQTLLGDLSMSAKCQSGHFAKSTGCPLFPRRRIFGGSNGN
jgi:hypothetical protein